MLFDPSTPNGNPNQNTLCGRKIKVSYGVKTITVTVADRCEGCPGVNDLDLSSSASRTLRAWERDASRALGSELELVRFKTCSQSQ